MTGSSDEVRASRIRLSVSKVSVFKNQGPLVLEVGVCLGALVVYQASSRSYGPLIRNPAKLIATPPEATSKTWGPYFRSL